MIGIFDSGSGGLTVLKAIQDVLPSADVVYFGDIQHAPYGIRSQEELSALTVSAIRFLEEKGANKIVSACNSVSAAMAVSLFDLFPIAHGDLIEMVGPTVSYFKNSTARILLVATPATIKSGIYQNAFRMVGQNIQALAVPDLAGAIEFGQPEEKLRHYISEALAAVNSSDYDVLILGCTHYPLVMKLFEDSVPSSTIIFDPALAVAERAKSRFWPQEVGNGTIKFFITRDSAIFRRYVTELFPTKRYSVDVVYAEDALKGVV